MYDKYFTPIFEKSDYKFVGILFNRETRETTRETTKYVGNL